jgi:Zn-finger nucleic acid-binding protein
MFTLADEIPARRCGTCDGVFITPWPWAELLSRARASEVARSAEVPAQRRQLPPAKLFESVYCPRCRSMMDRACFAMHSSVTVDVCVWHGIWFDAGELATAVAWVEETKEDDVVRRLRHEADGFERQRRLQSAVYDARGDANQIYEKLMGMGDRLGLLPIKKP